jgi:UDP-N-acetylmuramoylalanine--D-glutamate ligase
VHLIAGGREKGAEWGELARAARTVARRVLLVGEAAPLLREHFGSGVELVDCQTVPAAVETAFRDARPGDVVLLSPGCASFDQYGPFEERGEDFRAAVKALADR